MPFSPVAAAVAAVVSAVESANHQRRMTTTNTWTQKTWRPRSKQSRMEEEVSLEFVRKGSMFWSDSSNTRWMTNVSLIWQFVDVKNCSKGL